MFSDPTTLLLSTEISVQHTSQTTHDLSSIIPSAVLNHFVLIFILSQSATCSSNVFFGRGIGTITRNDTQLVTITKYKLQDVWKFAPTEK